MHHARGDLTSQAAAYIHMEALSELVCKWRTNTNGLDCKAIFQKDDQLLHKVQLS